MCYSADVYNRKEWVKAVAEAIFKKTFKGYDTNQVDEFLVMMSDKYTQNEAELNDKLHLVEAENERLKAELTKLREQSDENERNHAQELIDKQKEYDALCAEIGEKMVIADKRAADIIKNAEKEAELILTDARRSSENEARAIRMRAEGDAQKLIDDTRRKCDSLSAAAEEFRARQNEMNQSIRETESRFADALNRLSANFSEQE